MFVLDGAVFSEFPQAELQLSVRPNPRGFRLVTISVLIEATALAFVQITVRLSIIIMYIIDY